MSLPFSADQFFDVFGRYNEDVWPLQLALLGVGVVIAALLAFRTPGHGRTINTLLMLLWGWMGLVYHLMFFLEINRAALLFAAACFAQGLVFLVTGIYGRRLVYHVHRGARATIGWLLIGYGLVVYPLLSLALGSWPEVPSFGVPCPTTIFTIGVLCFLRTPFPRYVFLVPVLWSAIGSVAIVQFGLLQDLGLVAAGLVGLRLMIRWHGAPKVAFS